jgi:hypothetical protein
MAAVKRTRPRGSARRRASGTGASTRGRTPARRAAREPAGTVTRLNPDPDEVQKSVVQLVLSLVEFLRELMERQAVRRMDEGTLTEDESESVGLALMQLEGTIVELSERFGIDPADLNLDLGPLGRLR